MAGKFFTSQWFAQAEKVMAWKVSTILLAFTCLTRPQAAVAEVAVAQGYNNAVAYTAPNNVPVVDIATPNSAGLSHNFYEAYSVDSRGLVLNNGDSSQMARQSQLAGQVSANLNLLPGKGASLILNEVVSTNRTKLEGFTEVLGKTADVVVANPNGISCNGCGFINTPNVTLTTGKPNLTNGALTSVTVVDGDITITGTGANATNQEYLALVARKIKIEGQINGDNVDVIAGANTWDHVNKTATANAATGTTPDYAIDSSSVGGMYANRIRLIATEAGVGVRMLGDASASGTDISINSAGKIQIASKVSAQRDVALTTTHNSSDSIKLTNANLTAQRNIDATATGGVNVTGSGIKATNNITINAASLTDAASNASVTDNNKRYAGNNLSITTSGAATVNDTTWGANKALNGNFASLTVGADGATIYSEDTLDLNTSGNMALNTAYLQSKNNANLTSTGGTISTTYDAEQGIRVTDGNLVVKAQTGLNNGGTMTTDTGTTTLRTANLTNTGTIHSKDGMAFADYDYGNTGSINNNGVILGENYNTVSANSVTNTSAWQSNKGIGINTHTFTNSGDFIASTDSNSTGTILASNSITNQAGGVMQSAKSLVLTAENSVTNTGKMLAGDDITIKGRTNTTTLAVTNNSGATIQATDTVKITGGSGDNATLTNAGTILGNLLDIDLASANNSGTLQSNDSSDIDISGSLTNSGTLLTENQLDLTTNSINNSGTVQANKGSTANIATTLTNSGTYIASDNSSYNGTINARAITNSTGGVIQSANDLTANILLTLNNTGKILAGDDILLQGQNVNNQFELTNNSAGIIQAVDEVAINGANGGSNAKIVSQAGKIIGDKLAFDVVSVTNSGTIQGGAKTSTITASGTITNSSGGKIIVANDSAGSGTLNANVINNSGIMQSANDMAINVLTTFNNNTGAKVLTSNDLTFRGLSSDDYAIVNASRIQADGNLSIKGYNNTDDADVFTGSSTGIILAGTADILADEFDIGNDGGLTTFGNLTLDTNSLSLANSGSYIVAAADGNSGDVANITVGSAFTNNGAVHSGYDMNFTAPSIDNTNTGGFSALHNLTVTASTGNFDNYGALYAGNLLTANADGTFRNRETTGTMDSDEDIVVNADTFINNSTLVAGDDITINADTFRNEITGGVPNRSWHTYDVQDSTSGDGDFWSAIFGDSTFYYTRTYTREQRFDTTPSSNRASIVAGDALTVNFVNGYNTASRMNATTINLNGTGSFTNEELSLERRFYTETWEDWRRDCIFGICDYYYDQNHQTSYNHNAYSTGSGAGLFATNLNGTGGFSLVNISNATAYNALNRKADSYSPSVSSSSKSGASGTGLSSGESATTGANSVSGTTTASGASAITFGGLTITLPTNPNGYFVPTSNNNSHYLIETNPKFQVGSNFTGSDFMAKRLGINPDEMQKRLGDSNYEGHLVRQQLMEQTGRNLLNREESENQQMERLMTNGVDQATKLGLKIGQPLNPQQIANLGQDMVWMVEVEVKGQKVLTPVVYLSQNTKAMFDPSGATLAADNMNLDVKSLTNTGGTIEGKKTLSVTSKEDITNTSGTIKGGDVSLKSTEGSIVNKTIANTTGGGDNIQTTIGKQAGIEATGNLSLDAKKDITNLGANMSAGGNADLKAGNNITFDTVEDKEAKTTRASANLGFATGSYAKTETETKQIKSGLTVGGDLKSKSGADTTFAGTDVKVGGNADIDAGKDLNILNREDSKSTSTTVKTSSMFSSNSSTKSEGSTTNVGSTFDVGGNLKSKSANNTTIQGSDVTVGGNAEIITGGDLKILDGKNTKTSSESKSSSGLGQGGSGSIYGSETETTEKFKQDSVASNLKVGGNLKTDSKGDTTIKGSNVEAGGDVDMKTGGDLNVLAGENIETTKHTKTTTGFGLMGASAEGSAGADSDAAKSGKSGNGTAKGSAAAKAEAGAEGEARLTLMRSTTETEETYDKTHTASTIKSGGNMKLDAGKDMKVVGSDIEAGGDVDLKAGKNMTFEAAEDIHEEKSSKSVTEAGLYAEGSASAGAHANASGKASGMGASGKASAGAQANVEVGVGLYGETNTETNVEGSSTARTSTIKSGGNMSRSAGEKLTDVGTQVEAGGNYSQEAKEIENKAAADKTWASSTSETNTAKVGAYAEAGAEAGASGHAGTGSGANGKAKAEASATAGGKASFERSTSEESSATSTAVTGSIKAGGNVSSKSSGKTTLEGTNIEAGGDGNIEAGSLEWKAARDTETSTSSSEDISAELKAGYGAKAEANANEGEAGAGTGIKASLEAGYSSADEKSESSKAVVGSMKTGGNMKITTKGDSTFEGTNLEATKDASIKSEEGSVNFNAARDTEKTSGKNLDVNANLQLEMMGDVTVGGGAEVGYGDSKTESSKAVVGGVKAGGNLDVSAKKDINLEGTNLESGGDASLEAKEGSVNFNAAKDTYSESSTDVNVGFELETSVSGGDSDGGSDADGADADGAGKKEGGKKRTYDTDTSNAGGDISAEEIEAEGNEAGQTKEEQQEEAEEGSEEKGMLDASVNVKNKSSTKSTAGSIKSGGNIKVKSGKDVNLEGTNIEAKDNVKLDAGGNVNLKAAESTSSNTEVDAGLSLNSVTNGGSTGHLEVGVGNSTTQQGVNIKSGSTDIKAKNDINMTGTKVDSKGDVNVEGKKVNMNDAKSSSTQVDVGISGSNGGAQVDQLGVGVDSSKSATEIKSGGKVNIKGN